MNGYDNTNWKKDYHSKSAEIQDENDSFLVAEFLILKNSPNLGPYMELLLDNKATCTQRG